MKSRTQKLLAALLTICMIVSMMVVPASATKGAADGKIVYTLEVGADASKGDVTANGTGTYVEGYFSVLNGVYDKTSNKYGHGTEILGDGESAGSGYTPSASLKLGAVKQSEVAKADKKTISFTTKYNNAQVTVWWTDANDSRKVAISTADGGSATSGTDLLNFEAVAKASHKSTVTVPTAGTKVIVSAWKSEDGKSGGDIYVHKVEVVDGDLNEATAVAIDDKTTTTLGVEAELQLSATVTATDSSKPCSDEVKWTTSDEEIATVDQTGKVTAVADGPVTITVTAGKQSDSITLTVGSGTKHTHGTTWTEDDSTWKEPTCTEPGSVTEKCENADCPGREKEIPATGHNWGDDNVCANGCGDDRVLVYVHFFDGTDGSGNAQKVTNAGYTASYSNSSGSQDKIVTTFGGGVGGTVNSTYKHLSPSRANKMTASSRGFTFTAPENGTLYVHFDSGSASKTLSKTVGETTTDLTVPTSAVYEEATSAGTSYTYAYKSTAVNVPYLIWVNSVEGTHTEHSYDESYVKNGTWYCTYPTCDYTTTEDPFVTVPEVTEVTVKTAAGESATEVSVGEADKTVQMTAAVKPNAAPQTVTWSVTPADQGVTVSATGLVTVAPTATKGDYTVTAASTADSTKSGSATVTVKVVEVDSVTIEKDGSAATTAAMKVGDAPLTLTAEVNFAAASAEPGDDDDNVTWSSDNTNVATVDASGKVTAVKAGTATITATSVKDTTKKAELTLTVEKGTVSLRAKTRGVTIPSTGREVVFKVGKPGTTPTAVIPLPDEVFNAITVRVNKTDASGEDVTASLNVQKKTTSDEGAPMAWNYAMTLPANTDTENDVVYLVTLSFAGIEEKWEAVADYTFTFKVAKPGAPVITLNRHTTEDDDTEKTITSGAELVLSLDAMVEVDDTLDASATANLTFTWTKDGQPITAVDSECQVEGHVGHRQSTYTVAAATSADAGEYKCVISSPGAESQEITLTVTVNKQSAAAPTTAAFEAATMTLSGVDATMEYSVDEGDNWVAITGTTADLSAANVTPAKNIWVRYAETAEAAASEHQLINIDRAATPTLTAGDQSITISSPVADAVYEIKSADGDWATATVSADGKITGLTNGTAYQVRMKGKGTALTSAAASATPRENAPDLTPLRNAITAANTAKSGVEVSTDGTDVGVSKQWVTQAQMDDLDAAITVARATLNGDTTTAQDVTVAVTILNAAVETFNGQKQAGTMEEDPGDEVDKTDLIDAIAAAEAAKAEVVESADGSDVDTTKKWVTPEDMAAFTDAIEAAQAVVDDDEATEDDVADALADLAAAVADFEAAQEDGEKLATTVEGLQDAVDAAKDKLTGVVVSADGKDVAKDKTWVTSAVKDALDQAIEDAEAVIAKGAEATEEEITDAASALKDASAAFVPAAGTKADDVIIGTGGGTVSGGDTGVTVIKGDGAKTETVTNDDGSSTTTTVDKDGNKTIVTETPDGAKTEIVSKADGEKTITVTDANGEETVSVKVPATVPAPETPFVDVPEEHWAKESIDAMAGLGLVNGVDAVNHIYDMNSDITRGALASVLYRFSNGKAGLTSNFNDVLSSAWYADGVAWADKVGVVKGYGDGTFGPEKSITRQELAVMLYRYAKLIGMDTGVKAEITRFNDSEAVASWAMDAMTWCVEAGIIKGVGGNTLNPEGVASRAECAVMLSRFVDLV